MNPSIKRVDTPFGRVYLVKTESGSALYPSVTTVLSSEPQQWLKTLSNNIGEEELAKISAKAAGRGTVMHTYLENYLICVGYHGMSENCLLYTQKKTLKELSNRFDEQTIAKGRDLFYNMLDSELFVRMRKPLFSEKFLWSHKHMFAGTADFGYVENGSDGDILGDFKSANSPRGEEQISKYMKQLGAYAVAYEEQTQRPVKRAEIWISHPEGIQTVKAEGAALQSAKENFIALCENYHKQWNKKEIVEYLKALKDSKMTTNGSESGSNT